MSDILLDPRRRTDGSLQIQSDLLHQSGGHVVLGSCVRGAVRVGLLMRSTWPAFEPYGDTLLLAALGAACFINFGRNRTLHCGLTGPLFLVAAIVAALMEAGVWRVNEEALWGVVLVGVALAFLIEWRVVGRQGHSSRA